MLPRNLVPYEHYPQNIKKVYIRDVLKLPLHVKQTERKDVNRIHLTQVTTQREGRTETIRT
jgi:phosphatidate phosphatase APP1